MTSLMGIHIAKGSCKVLMQATQEQNFGEEGSKKIVIGTGYVQADRREVAGSGWQGYWKCERKD